MILELIKSEGLAHFSYMIGDENAGVCAVIDPRRDVDVYLDLAQQYQVQITHILETHIHADFVSGSLELAAQTGAQIYVGAADEYGFSHTPLEDGDEIDVGDLHFRVLHTPGHTPEHVCFLVSGGMSAGQPWGLFSGDTLFAGEVGRPDLLGEEMETQLVRQLYDSLRDKLLTVGDEIIIYPSHGEGSPCGANIGDRQTSTIGYERRHNLKVEGQSREEFIEETRAALSPAPSYYPRMKKINAEGPTLLGQLPRVPALTVPDFKEKMSGPKTVVVDAREIEAFGGAHIAGAINIGLREPFPVWAGRILDETFPIWSGWMLDPKHEILLVLPAEAKVDDVVRQLLRIGYENIGGYLRHGLRAWIEAGEPFERIPQLSVHHLKEQLDRNGKLQVLDVRTDQEWAQGHIPTAQHIFLPTLEEQLDELDPERPVATYCGSGYRAGIAASLLKRNGFKQVYNIPGSLSAWLSAGFSLEKN